MLVDGLLDRDGAGHGGALAEGRGSGAERETGQAPERLQRGRAHAPGGEFGLEDTPGAAPPAAPYA